MDFAGAINTAFEMRIDSRRMTSLDVPIALLTDGICSFEVIAETNVTSDKRLMVDVKGSNRAYLRQ